MRCTLPHGAHDLPTRSVVIEQLRGNIERTTLHHVVVRDDSLPMNTLDAPGIAVIPAQINTHAGIHDVSDHEPSPARAY